MASSNDYAMEPERHGCFLTTDEHRWLRYRYAMEPERHGGDCMGNHAMEPEGHGGDWMGNHAEEWGLDLCRSV